MRHNIWEKDDFFEIGGKRIDMDPAVVTLPDEVPLMWNFNMSDPKGPYGRVTDIRLEDGQITGEVTIFDPTWNDDTMKDLGCRLGGYYKSIIKTAAGDVVTYCELKAVSIMLLTQTPGWPSAGTNPGAKINEENR